MSTLRTVLLVAASVGRSAALPSVYRAAHFAVANATDIAYASTLVNCTVGTDAATCVKTVEQLDIFWPLDAEEGRPVVFSIHGGGFSGGAKGSDYGASCDYWRVGIARSSAFFLNVMWRTARSPDASNARPRLRPPTTRFVG